MRVGERTAGEVEEGRAMRVVHWRVGERTAGEVEEGRAMRVVH